MNDQTHPIQLRCRSCNRDTRHDLLFTRRSQWDEYVEPEPKEHGGFHIDGSVTYELLTCRGCEDVTLRRTEAFSEWEANEVTLYPPREFRSAPRWVHHLPHDVKSLHQEVYTALHADSRCLAAMGMRAILDMAMTRALGGDGGTFSEKLEQMVHKEQVLLQQMQTLSEVRP